MKINNKNDRHANRNDLAGEHILGDMGQIVFFFLFLTIWIGDSFIFDYSTFLSESVIFLIRLPIAGVVLTAAIYLMREGLKIVFDEVREKPSVVRHGVFGIVRHPVYLGSILFYLSLSISTLSLLSFIILLGIFLFYDFIAGFEEQLLTLKFGSSYEKYMQDVLKWIPVFKLKSAKKTVNLQH